MEDSNKDTLVDSKLRERFFGAPEPSKGKPGRTIGKSKTPTRSCPDDPVPAAHLTSCKLDEPVRLQMSDKGALSQKPLTVMTALQMTADRYHDHDAFAVKVDGKWQKTKLRDMYRMVRTVAKGFLRLGLMRFHGVGIIGYNAPEWIISCLAAIFAGGVAVGIHYNHTVEDCKRVALMVQCNIIVVDSDDDLTKILEIRSTLPDLLAIVQYGTEGSLKIEGIVSWKDLLQMGERESDDRLKECILAQAPNYCCMVTFTMGRTGPPKSVMESHDNVIWTAKVFGKYQSFSNSGGAHVSFLPLSQPIGQLLDIFVPLIYATTVYFVPRKLLKHKLVDVMREVHPTFFLTIPFFYERILSHLQLSLEASPFKRSITKTAINIGLKAYHNAKEGKPRPFGWWLANRLVFKKIQRRLGFDRCVEVHSAGSFLLPSTAEIFIGLSMVVLIDYGSSELSGPHAVSLPDRYRLGSCGVEMDGCRTKFTPIEKSIYTEMRVKGRHVFMGYLNEPEMTADAFDENGWYKTTDMGYRDESGFLYIIGSTCELFTLTDGRVAAPIPIEIAVKDHLPCMGHCIAFGHNRPYVIMLFTLEASTDDQTDIPLDILSKKAELWLRKKKVEISAISQMVANPPDTLVAVIQSVIDQVNSSVLDQATAIRKWKLLPRDLSIPTGELNPSHREKRHLILDLHAETIDAIYDSR